MQRSLIYIPLPGSKNKPSVIANGQKINNIALFLALLFHVSGAIGMILTPYKDWFISYTPFTLLVMFVLLLLTQEQKKEQLVLVIRRTLFYHGPCC